MANISNAVLFALADKAKVTKFHKNTTIIMEGDETNSFYIVLSGKVKVFSSDDKDKELTLLIQEAGTYFGELALLTDEPRSASVIALETTVCAVISKTDFINWLLTYPVVAISLLCVLSDKVRQLTEKVKQLALSNVYERTIQTLESMSVVDGDKKVIQHRPTQQDLASMVGASREMVNKILKELIKGGYITIEDKRMLINKKFPSSW